MVNNDFHIKIILILILILAGKLLFRTSSDYPDDICPYQNFDIIAHRGASGLAPENTLEAVDLAISHKAKYVEVDVRQTMDSVLILMHDKSIKRTTNQLGKVHELLWSDLEKAEIRKSDFRSLDVIKIPSLAQILERVKDSDTKLVLEIKEPDIYPNIARKLIEQLRTHNMMNKVVIISFDHNFLRALKTKFPTIKIGALFILKPSAKAIKGFDYISIYSYTLIFFPSIIKMAHQNSTKVWAWTVNESKQIQRLLNRGVNGITTDYPNKFRGQCL